MAYLKGDRSTLWANRDVESLKNVSHIIPDVLYPAWSGLLTDNTGYTFTDSSASGHAVVEQVGDVHHNGNPKVGTTSISFPGTAQNSLRYADSADWDFGTGAFTIECWINTKKVSGSASTIVSRTINDSQVVWMLRVTGSARVEFTKNNAAGSDHESSSYTVVANTWTHIAIVRGGVDNKVRMYADGVKIYTSAAVDTGDYSTSGTEWWFGANPTGTQNLDGYIDEFRYCKGLAVYTDAFTPPTSALSTTWSANPFGGSNTVANATASNVKLLLHSDNGGHVGAYGTEQADERKYYYTDIKGSKPIKDPRIGSHFGSQRHGFTSMQLLEQETATHGSDIYSVDGREYFRFSRGTGTVSGAQILNDANGVDINVSGNGATGQFIEIVGYFNQANVLIHQQANSAARTLVPHINGGPAGTASEQPTIATPLGGRYVSAPNLSALTFQTAITTPGINTLKLTHNNYDTNFFGIELIAQDTTSTATKSQIQIPSQNVVSYGKKYTVSGTPHYDPFNGFTNSTSLHSAFVDTATSLGLSTAPGLSAKWAISGSNNIRPYNGGRVVKWVDSSGVIKTSVNMMPPNAQNIIGTVVGTTEVTTPSATNATPTPIFSDDAIDHSQAEVAKKFHWREFGNGSANGGSAGATWADASMVDARDNVAYVMDDGLTGLHIVDAFMCGTGDLCHDDTASENNSFTFIGTGVGWISTTASGNAKNITVAQNLPYGTHILRTNRSGSNEQFMIDGIAITGTAFGTYGSTSEVSFHQPKMPPIPEDAVVIADYMLMADFVAQTATGIEKISKGVRLNSCSRDVFFDSGSAQALYINPGFSLGGFQCDTNANTNVKYKLPFFGNGFQYYWSNNTTYAMVNADITIDGSAASTGNFSGLTASTPSGSYNSSTGVLTPTGGTRYGEALSLTGLGLGQQTVQLASASDPSGTNRFRIDALSIDSPIHTSSHYQAFETPYLYELVGGDRNMEQTNLVVTADGKTWDEVTRDTSYMGGASFSGNSDGYAQTSTSTKVLLDEFRGFFTSAGTMFNKHFAIAYDRLICLYDGQYHITMHNETYGTGVRYNILWINGTRQTSLYEDGATPTATGWNATVNISRGEDVYMTGVWGTHRDYTQFQIHKI
jgi:hypothetical protein